MQIEDEYDAAGFARLVEREHERIELKTRTGNKPLQDTMVAFSNTRGGVILIGVKDDRSVQGRQLDQGTDDDIHRAARAAHNLGRLRVLQIEVANQTVVAVVVSAREGGFAQTSEGRVLVRRGGNNEALLGADLQDLLNERSLRRFESTDSSVALADVRPENVAALAEGCRWTGAIEDRLREARLLTPHGTLTISGALLLTDPATSLASPKLLIDMTGYESDTSTDYVRRERIAGTVQEQIRRATRQVMRDIGVDLVVTGAQRQDIPRLPAQAVREVIANAVAHRSYEQTTAAITIEIRPSRVVITSPGRLPDGVTVESLRDANAPRNPDLIEVLRLLDLAEDRGRGIDLIQDRMRDDFLPDPVFEDGPSFVRVSMPTGRLITAEERGWVLHVRQEHDLSDNEVLLLVNAVRRGELTNATARAAIHSDSQQTRNMLRRLRDLGLLEQQGQRGGATYRIGTLGPRRTDEQVVVDLASQGFITNGAVRQALGVGRQDALSLLRRLVAQGRLRQHGQRRGTRYSVVEEE